MNEPLFPPPRRSASQELRDRIELDLATADRRRFKLRHLAAPVAAGTLVVATVLGVSTLSGQRTAEPANPSQPTSPTTSASPTPSSAAALSLDGRAMTAAEIAADTRACNGAGASVRVKGPTAQFSRVQRRAGVTEPSSTEVRKLIKVGASATWSCSDGAELITSSRSGAAEPSKKKPAVQLSGSGVSGECGARAKSRITTDELYAVDDSVATARVRINRGQEKGAWQSTAPSKGLVSVPLEVTGEDAWSTSLSYDIQFLDRSGQQLSTPSTKLGGCATMIRPTVEPDTKKLTPPSSDARGAAQCLAMAYAADPELTPGSRGSWKTKVVVSTSTEWGAVLSDGKRRFGCSLAPTAEVSGVTADKASVSKSSFTFAMNPIEATNGTSIWATGRAPDDVSKISFRLPDGRDVPATIDSNGYWMMKHHVNGADLATGNVADWAAVVVTVTRPTGTTTHRVKLNENTMCNQISHGC